MDWEPMYVGKLVEGNWSETYTVLNTFDASELADFITDIVHRELREGMPDSFSWLYTQRHTTPLQAILVQQAMLPGLDDATNQRIRVAQADCLDRGYDARREGSDQWMQPQIDEVFGSIESFRKDTPEWDYWRSRGMTFLSLLDVLDPLDEEPRHTYAHALGMIMHLKLMPEYEFWQQQVQANPRRFGPMALRAVTEQVSPDHVLDILDEVQWDHKSGLYMAHALRKFLETHGEYLGDIRSRVADIDEGAREKLRKHAGV